MAKFNGKNDISRSAYLFAERARFQQQAYSQRNGLGPPTVLDFNFAERTLYGRINPQGNAIIVKPSKLKPFNILGGEISTLNNLDFVTDSFSRLQRHFNRAIQFNKIPADSTFLSSIEPMRAYVSPYEMYQEYIADVMTNYVESYLIPHKKIDQVITFDDFLKYLVPFAKLLGEDFPLFLTGFQRSKRSSIFTSGLAIDLGGHDIGRDDRKYDWYISSPSFDYYVNVAKQYGFSVSRNAPWIIVADLASPVMERSVSSIISDNYIQTRTVDLQYFKNALVLSFNYLVDTNPYMKQNYVCSTDIVTKSRIKFRQRINNNALIKYEASMWLKLYAQLRNIEEREPFRPSDLKKVIKKALFYEKKFDIKRAMGYINEEFRSLYKYKDGNAYSIRKRIQKIKSIRRAQSQMDINSDDPGADIGMSTGTSTGGGY